MEKCNDVQSDGDQARLQGKRYTDAKEAALKKAMIEARDLEWAEEKAEALANAKRDPATEIF